VSDANVENEESLVLKGLLEIEEPLDLPVREGYKGYKVCQELLPTQEPAAKPDIQVPPEKPDRRVSLEQPQIQGRLAILDPPV
jgi:hypothetical protein